MAHAALALVPFTLHQSKETAILPYYSYFGVLAVFEKLGLSVFSEFREGMFMAPVSTWGKAAVAVAWLLFHGALAAAVLSLWHRLRFESQSSRSGSDA